jgi:maleylpyruvate isomerase
MGDRPTRHLDEVRRAHRALWSALEGLDDRHVARPSQLPGWTVGHVLTHLARNADSHVRLITAAGRGEIGDQYPPGPHDDAATARAAEIEAGARRRAAELVDDVRRSAEALEAAWDTCSELGWAGQGRSGGGQLVPVRDLPFRRWREVEVHRVDLGPGVPGSCTPADWPAAYVREESVRLRMLWDARVPMGLAGLPAPVRALDERGQLAWLLGRRQVEGVPPAGLLA